MRRALQSVSDGLNTVTWSGAALFLCVMLALVVIQIVARYFIQDAPSWTEEGARYAMIWGGLLGGVSAFHQNADPVVVDIQAGRPLVLRRARIWAQTLCVACFTLVLLVHSVGFVERASARSTDALGWNLAIIASIIPIYAGLVLVQAVLKLAVFEIDAFGDREEPDS